VLPVQVVTTRPQENVIVVELAGQELTSHSDVTFPPGQKLWLICPQLRARRRNLRS